MSSHLKQLVKMEEVRIDGIKMDFPQRMTGEESENTRAQMFYAATSKLMAAKKKISARARIKKLAEYCNLAYLGDLESESLTDLYQCKLMDPTQWMMQWQEVWMNNMGGLNHQGDARRGRARCNM